MIMMMMGVGGKEEVYRRIGRGRGKGRGERM